MEDILNNFEATSLSEMDNVKLMNRVDTKYIFHKNELEKLLKLLYSDYKILEIENKRLMNYSNDYFDTSDFKLYLAHHNGKLNRYKIRIRQYVESETFFTEIKFKNNKGKTKKKRVLTKEISVDENNQFVKKNSPYYLDELEKKLEIDFQRFTLVHKTKNERATIDLNLRFNRELKLRNMVIAEIKQESYQSDSELIKALRSLTIRQNRMSKYCIGIALTHENLKKNKFKSKLRKIDKIEQTA